MRLNPRIVACGCSVWPPIKPLLRRLVAFQSAAAILLLKAAFSREGNSLRGSLGFLSGFVSAQACFT